MTSPSIEERFRNAIALHQAGDVEQAARLYQEILHEDGGHAGAWHLLGVVQRARGDLHSALEHIERALSIREKAVYRNNYGVVLRDLGRREDAAEAFRRAISLNPGYADAHSNLGLYHLDQSDFPQALASLQEALRLEPNHVDALLHLADYYHALRNFKEAENCHRRILAGSPDSARTWVALGGVLLADHRPSEAAQAIRRAIELAPTDAEAHLRLADAYANEGRVNDAITSVGRACEIRPDRQIWRLRTLGICPAVFPNRETLDQYRHDLEARLDKAIEEPVATDWEECVRDALPPPFELAHHGQGNRPIKEKFAQVFARYFPQRRPSARNVERPRVGFLVTRGREAGFLRDTGHIVARIDSERFEPVVLCAAGGYDFCRRAIRSPQVHWVAVPHDFRLAVECIAKAQIDILYHRQIGTDPFNYFLPFPRLAPIQCTGWATHGTTGLPAVDYYLSSKLMETENASEHFTERLYLVNTFPTCQARIPAPSRTTKSEFGLPDSGALYFCPHRIQKFHPDFDPLLRGILESDHSGTIAILQGRHSHARQLLEERFQRTLGEELVRRIFFLPTMPPQDYYRLMSLADAILDAPHYSASLTGFDAFSLGVPIVTWPGIYNVERYALGLYRRMGIEEFVAYSPQRYVELAVRLGRDEEYRRFWLREISNRSEILFDDATAVRDHEAFFDHCWARRGELDP